MILRLFLMCFLVEASLAQDDLIIKTSYGSIQGYETASQDGTRVRIFKAVPFAAPPMGDLRWKLPEEPKSWIGVKDGRKYSAACMSNSTTSKSPQKWVDEDCLYLNVFMHGECSVTKRCPIVVYFHGGEMNSDSATYFNDTVLIETFAANGVMLIIPAFRLGFTGQFTLGDNQELIPSNLGVHDAIHALKYVKREAEAFGGDTEAITVMGHSFGGTLANMLAFSPVRQSQVSIKQFIMMSSGIYFYPPEETATLSAEMIRRAGCSDSSINVTLQCMRSKSGHELLAIQRKLEEEGFGATRINGEVLQAYNGIVMGGILMQPPLFPFKSIPEFLENPPNANILIGSTCKDMDFPNYPNPPFVEPVGSLIGAENVQELGQLYINLTLSGKNNQTHSPKTQEIYVGTYLTAKSVTNNGFKAFVYSFDHPTHNHHTDDLSYIMGIHPFEQDEHEQVIAKIYPQLFMNFTKYGTPSPDWKPFDENDRYFSIAVNVTTGRMPEMREHYEKETVDFWTKEAPGIDKTISATRSVDMQVAAVRDLQIQNETTPEKTDTLILVHRSYYPSFILIVGVFLIGLALGRYLLDDSSSDEERMRILEPQGLRIDRGKPPSYAEQLF